MLPRAGYFHPKFFAIARSTTRAGRSRGTTQEPIGRGTTEKPYRVRGRRAVSAFQMTVPRYSGVWPLRPVSVMYSLKGSSEGPYSVFA